MKLSALVALVIVLAIAAPASAADDVQQAQGHFKRGVDLYEDSDFPAALVEFRRAYDLVPNHRVLYNLGRVAAAHHDYAAALGYYRKYLADGGAQLTAVRRREVEDELQKLAGRVGQLKVVVDVADAQVAIDDVPVGVTPLAAPLVVNAGRRRVVATAPSAPPVARIVEIAGQELVTIALEIPLPAPPATRPPELRAPPPVQPRPLVPRPTARAAESRTWPVALCWTTTGLLAAGSAVAGFIAVTSARDLRELRESYPASPDDLDRVQRRTRTAALVADSLLAGTALFSALSLYVTLSGPAERTTVSVGPGSLLLSGRF